MKKIIGVCSLYDYEKKSIWMLPGYMNGIENAGGATIILPLTDDREVLISVLKNCSGVLLTGGQDVSPDFYGEKSIKECGETCKMRDKCEKIVLDYALENDIPVLGICRGIQFLNAYLGGTLYQDLDTQFKTETDHHMTPPYDRAVHNVDIVKDSPLYELLKKDRIGVNSYHHQAVKELAKPLTASAYSEDGLVEGVYMKDKKFVWAVQWHPEFSFESDEDSMKILSAFVSST